MPLRARIAAVVLGVAIAVFASQSPVAGQEPPQEDVLNTLLVEVRALRGAIEQMTSASARIQLAVGRLQIQEQRVNGLLRRLGELREPVALAEREVSDVRARLEGLRKAVRNSTDAARRQEFASVARERERLLTTASAELQQLQAEEAELESLVSAEQGRWISINNQLEDLDRILQRQ
jgi:predicted  nucleic acid-binding Zn-ribbon protein